MKKNYYFISKCSCGAKFLSDYEATNHEIRLCCIKAKNGRYHKMRLLKIQKEK